MSFIWFVRLNLNSAVETAQYAQYANGQGLCKIGVFTDWVKAIRRENFGFGSGCSRGSRFNPTAAFRMKASRTVRNRPLPHLGFVWGASVRRSRRFMRSAEGITALASPLTRTPKWKKRTAKAEAAERGIYAASTFARFGADERPLVWPH